MIITRKFGSLVRGKATPFQIYSACLLGALLGMIPSFGHAPALFAFWSFLLLVLNANLFLAGLVGLASKLLLAFAMPLVFLLGRMLLEGPTQGLFAWLVNAPVTAYSGLDYYAVAGGQFFALVVGVALGLTMTRSLAKYRRKMQELEGSSEKFNAYADKLWVKVLKFLFLGSGKGKKTYDELLKAKIGNPIRIWGAGLVLVCLGLLVFGFGLLSTPLLTSLLQKNLESANGATVDLESVDMDLGAGRLEIVGLEMADAQKLDTNIFSSERIVADVSSRDLLRKRFTVDSLVFEDAASGAARATPGSRVGPKPKEKSASEIPEFDDLGAVLDNAGVWKDRLAQAKRWLEKIGGSDDEAAKGAEQASFKEKLSARIRALGHANVKADFLVRGSPSLWIRDLQALGIRTPYLDGAALDLTGSDLSTHPALAGSTPELRLVSDGKQLEMDLSLAGTSGLGSNALSLKLSDLAVDSFASQLQRGGESLLSGGTVDLDLSGAVGAAANDLVAKLRFEDSSALVGGNRVPLDGVTLPIAIKGPLDSPGVKVESDAIQKVLLGAGKRRLLDEVSKKLGDDSGEKSGAGQLLEGLFRKKEAQEGSAE